MKYNKEGEPTLQQIKILWVHNPDYLIGIHQNRLEKQIGGKIELVLNAQEALEILEQQEEARFPDIIVSDCYMPLMNGFEFAKAVKNHKNEKIRSLPLCIASSLVKRPERESLRQLDVPIFDKKAILYRPEKICQFYEESKEVRG